MMNWKEKEAVVRYNSGVRLEELRKTTKKLNQDG
jgi:hypothetical protein